MVLNMIKKNNLKERLAAIMYHNKKSKLSIIISVILLGFVILGALYLGGGLGIAKATPTNSNIDIGGYSLFIKSEGKGTPTVVFESPTGETSSYWSVVSDVIQKHTRTVIYDRAGLGKSEKSPYNRTSEQKAIELHSLLKKAKIKPPYIFVGCEYGVHNIRMFAAKYPKEVAGIIMVDARSENLKEITMSLLPENEKLSDTQIKQSWKENSSKSILIDLSYEDYITSNQQVKTYLDSIKTIPVTAIVSGTDSTDPLTKAIVEDQKQEAALSGKNKVISLPGSVAYVSYSCKDIIIREILKMLNQVK